MKFITKNFLGPINYLSVPFVLGWQDIKLKYRRSKLGPFWMTANMAVMICCVGVVFGYIFGANLHEYLPYLAINIITWNYINAVIVESCNAFESNASMIKQLPIPYYVYVLRIIWRNIIIFAHNFAIIPVLILVFNLNIGLSIFTLPLSFFLISFNLFGLSIILAVVCARFRDLPPLVSNFMQIIYYVTPIMWAPTSIPKNPYFNLILQYNPFNYAVRSINGPFFGKGVLVEDAILLATGVIVALLSLSTFKRYKKKIPFWL